MAKDARRNVDGFKISGGALNEFEFHKNQEQLAEHSSGSSSHLIPGTPPEARAEHIQEVVRKAQRIAKKRTSKPVIKGASAKKLAARKAAAKK